jgi:4-amino-4-deoxy-L-arabinose transferase-like glycosyltransferase
MATCVGLFLFTRVLIPDVLLTLTITLSMWSFLRLLEDDEPHRGRWSFLLAASLGAGVLLKSLIAVVLPAGGAFLYLLATRQLFGREALARLWTRLRPVSTIAIVLAITLPWFVLATLRNPPYFDFTLQSGPGQYHGFFWRYFINEQVLRFLNRRYPHDYDTVPRTLFWLLNLVWLFPWSVYLPALARQSFRPRDRAGRVRLLALCWGGFVLLFFTFSTTQEYYSMPAYPALALLLGAAVAAGSPWIRRGTRLAAGLAGVGAVVAIAVLIMVWNVPTPGDIVEALTRHPEAYTLSLGHMQDLTLRSFAYFRQPLMVAAAALLVGALGGGIYRDGREIFALALMMAIFSQATRMALVVMEPELSSRALAEALNQSPPGELIVADAYYSFSSVFFYANRKGYLADRVNNLEYGSYAPGAPPVFIGGQEIKNFWQSPNRYYLLADGTVAASMGKLLGAESLHVVRESGGKFLFSNRPISEAAHP